MGSTAKCDTILSGKFETHKAATKLQLLFNKLTSVLLPLEQVQGNVRRGFSLTASAYSTGCGGLYHGLAGNISSPISGGSNKYPNGAECVWDIVGEPGTLFTKLIFFRNLQMNK